MTTADAVVTDEMVAKALREAFNDWHERWWKNEPNAIAKSNALAAFYAGWDARGKETSG